MLKKDLQVEDLYKAVEEIPKDIRFLAGMCDVVWTQGALYLNPIEEQTCLHRNPPRPGSDLKYTRYDHASLEYQMWMTSLISMCWLLTNVKKKTENGHCHNPIHEGSLERTHRADCAIGRACHSSFYGYLIDSLDRLLTYARQHTPVAGTSDPQ